jgi:hypothetical protein
MSAKTLGFSLVAGLLVVGTAAEADEGLASFRYVGQEAAKPVAPGRNCGGSPDREAASCFPYPRAL